MNEQTLTFTKPGNFQICFKIFRHLDDLLKENFTRTIPVHINPVLEHIIREHYKGISHLPIYEPTIDAFLKSNGIVLRVYGGINIIERVRESIGNTDPKKAGIGTIRQVFSNDSMEKAWKERRYLNNVIHASSDINEANREIELWKEYIKWTC